MDVIKPSTERSWKKHRRLAIGGGILCMVVAVVYIASALEAGAPVIDKTGLWIDTVEHGTMTREVRAVGTLVSDDGASLWLAAEHDSRVDRKLLNKGAEVGADTVIVQLSNPDVEQAATAADLSLQAAEAAYASLEAKLQTDLLSIRSFVAAIGAEKADAAIQAESDAQLAQEGLIARIKSRQSTIRAEALAARLLFEQDRVRIAEQALETQLAVQRAEVANRRTFAALKHRDLDSLAVRAGMSGVLQEIIVEEGQRVARNAQLARVVDPTRLKAELRIPEAQTADLRTGLPVKIDTHNGIVAGSVSRIAPAAQNGTVTIDVALEGAPPPGARADMTVDGIIEIERLDAVLHVGRPAVAELKGEVSLYRVSADGSSAERVPVAIGRVSATRVEIVGGGLHAGDRVVLSDPAAWGDQARVRFRQ